MKREDTRTWFASFRDRGMRIWEAGSGYEWEVTDSATREIVARGETVSRENAMVSAAGAAGADWGSARWRSAGEDDQE